MRRQPLLLCLVLAAAATAGHAQTSDTIAAGSIKQGWLSGTSLGLSVQRNDFRLPCASGGPACEEVSVVGRASFGASSLGLFGRVGSGTSVRTAALGTDSGFGLSYGAGLSWDFSPRASATLGWDSYDLRPGGAVRSTSLGLQLRY
jgi:hypothetical protein